MDDSLRYPIGNFEWPASVTDGDRREFMLTKMAHR